MYLYMCGVVAVVFVAVAVNILKGTCRIVFV